MASKRLKAFEVTEVAGGEFDWVAAYTPEEAEEIAKEYGCHCDFDAENAFNEEHGLELAKLTAADASQIMVTDDGDKPTRSLAWCLENTEEPQILASSCW